MFTFRLDSASMSVSERSPQAFRSPLVHRPSMLVSNQACWSLIRHVGLQSGMLVSDKACQSSMKYVGLRWVSDHGYVGLRSDMFFPDMAPIRHVGLPMGLRFFSDNNIFVGSKIKVTRKIAERSGRSQKDQEDRRKIRKIAERSGRSGRSQKDQEDRRKIRKIRKIAEN